MIKSFYLKKKQQLKGKQYMWRTDLKSTDESIYKLIEKEQNRQAEALELIPSENYISKAVQEAMGTILNNKYSEGYPGARYYGGQQNVDQIEELAISRAKLLFKAGHANVQPHSGAIANIAVYFALLEPGDTILGMDLSHGGHLTHGHPVTHMAKVFNFVRYKMSNVETGEIDYDELLKIAIKHKPKLIVAGFSAFPRNIDYAKMQSIADRVGAYTMADMAHISGFIAKDHMRNPFDDGFDIITTTTHKSLRGPRGGMILTHDEKLGPKIDKSVFPGLQGGPIVQMIAAKAVALEEVCHSDYSEYTYQTLENAKTLSEYLMEKGCKLVTNGTDNHLMVVDTIESFGIGGKEAERKLEAAGITVNKNTIPDDPRSPFDPSGIRIGTPAITTRGMREYEMTATGEFIINAIKAKPRELISIRNSVQSFMRNYPLPGESEE
jgi:glycine hydroxymethyltransferase